MLAFLHICANQRVVCRHLHAEKRALRVCLSVFVTRCRPALHSMVVSCAGTRGIVSATRQCTQTTGCTYLLGTI